MGKARIDIIAACTWAGMVIALIAGAIVHSDNQLMRGAVGLPERPFDPINWLLFGIVTGFMIGALAASRSKGARPEVVRIAHHGESEECRTCYYGNIPAGATCKCPTCMENQQMKPPTTKTGREN